MKIKISLAAILVGSTMGCSTTLLSCGVDGGSSYLNLSTPGVLQPGNTLQFSDLCNFNQESSQ